MATVNANRLYANSPFRSTEQVPLPKDATVGAQAGEKEEESSDEEEGAESSESQELSRQIDSHVVVLNEDQPRTGTTAHDQTTQLLITTIPMPENLSTGPAAPVPTPSTNITPGA